MKFRHILFALVAFAVSPVYAQFVRSSLGYTPPSIPITYITPGLFQPGTTSWPPIPQPPVQGTPPVSATLTTGSGTTVTTAAPHTFGAGREIQLNGTSMPTFTAGASQFKTVNNDFWVEQNGLTANSFKISAAPPSVAVSVAGSGYSADQGTNAAQQLLLTGTFPSCVIQPILAVTLSGTGIASAMIVDSGDCGSAYPTGAHWTPSYGLSHPAGTDAQFTFSDGGDVTTTNSSPTGVTVYPAGYYDNILVQWDADERVTKTGTFQVCAFAWAKAGGIQFVDFQADGGSPLRVTVPSVNSIYATYGSPSPITGIYPLGPPEYCFLARDQDFADGQHEFRLTACPNVGPCRVLQSQFIVAGSGTTLTIPAHSLEKGKSMQFAAGVLSGDPCVLDSSAVCYICYQTLTQDTFQVVTPTANYGACTSPKTFAASGIAYIDGQDNYGISAYEPSQTPVHSLYLNTNYNGSWTLNGKNYYVSNSGNNSNDCITVGTPCQTNVGAMVKATKLTQSGANGPVVTYVGKQVIGSAGTCQVLSTPISQAVGDLVDISFGSFAGPTTMFKFVPYWVAAVDNSGGHHYFALTRVPGGPCINDGTTGISGGGMRIQSDLSGIVINDICASPPCTFDQATQSAFAALEWVTVKPNNPSAAVTDIVVTPLSIPSPASTPEGPSLLHYKNISTTLTQDKFILLAPIAGVGAAIWLDWVDITGAGYIGVVNVSGVDTWLSVSSSVNSGPAVFPNRPKATNTKIHNIVGDFSNGSFARGLLADWMSSYGIGGTQTYGVFDSQVKHDGLYHWPVQMVTTLFDATSSSDGGDGVAGACDATATNCNFRFTTAWTSPATPPAGYVAGPTNLDIGAAFPAPPVGPYWKLSTIGGGYGSEGCLTIANTAAQNNGPGLQITNITQTSPNQYSATYKYNYTLGFNSPCHDYATSHTIYVLTFDTHAGVMSQTATGQTETNQIYVGNTNSINDGISFFYHDAAFDVGALFNEFSVVPANVLLDNGSMSVLGGGQPTSTINGYHSIQFSTAMMNGIYVGNTYTGAQRTQAFSLSPLTGVNFTVKAMKCGGFPLMTGDGTTVAVPTQATAAGITISPSAKIGGGDC